MSKRVKYTAAGLVIFLAALGGAAFLYRKHQGRDIRGSSSVEFVKTEPKAAKEPVGVTWPMYGYDTARLRAPVETVPGGQAVTLDAGVVTAAVAVGDGERSYLVAGTVTPDVVRTAGRDLLASDAS